MKKSVFVAVTNDISTDYRVHKICTSLLQKGFAISVYGRIFPHSVRIKREYHVFRNKHWFHHKFWFYAEYNLRLFIFLLFKKYDFILANDLDTLPACFLISKLKNIDLVYDSHELFTEVPELQERLYVKKFWRRIESYLLPKIKSAYTVSESIAQYYQKEYGIKMGVIRNMPFLNDDVISKPVTFPTSNKVILYQGVLNPGRGIKEVIRALHFLSEVDLVIIGYGKVEDDLRAFVKNQAMEHRVHFMGKIERNELPNYTKLASVGMVLEQPFGLSFQYALPNKLFDFIHAEIPMITSDLIEVRKIVNEYRVGLINHDSSPKVLAAQLSTLLQDQVLRAQMIKNQKKAKLDLCWEKEANKLDLYFKS